jgi:AcrR family transcriptional regulator
MSTQSKLDLRIRRSQQWLEAALIQLMREKPFREIQITEITTRAQVSRPTFYLHYQSKEELLLSLIDQVFTEFFNDLVKESSLGTYSKLALCTQLFKSWERHSEMLTLILAEDVQSQVITRLQKYLRKMFLFLKTQTGKPLADGLALDLMIGFMASGTYTLLVQWGLQKLPYTPEEMGLFLHQLTISHEEIIIQKQK